MSQYSGIDFTSSIHFTGEQRKFLLERSREWIKKEKEAEAKKDKNMFKGLAKMMKPR